MSKFDKTIHNFVRDRNAEKLLFTAGPAALLPENLHGLRPCFGRDDSDYNSLELRVVNRLKEMSGHNNLVRMQGSASLALEVMALNFLYGRVLIVQSGYYSERLVEFTKSAMRTLGQVKEIKIVNWQKLYLLDGKFDWIFTCYTETSIGLKLPFDSLKLSASRLKARLMLDATASIGLEPDHDIAEVIAYSSCKGLFGLTGAAFVAYHNGPTVEVDSFYLSMDSHIKKLMTGPYHAMASLDEVLSKHDFFREAVIENKKIFNRKMINYLSLPEDNQPNLCTHVNCKIVSRDERVILYVPRTNLRGSIVCHLGEVHLGRNARGVILSSLEAIL